MLCSGTIDTAFPGNERSHNPIQLHILRYKVRCDLYVERHGCSENGLCADTRFSFPAVNKHCVHCFLSALSSKLHGYLGLFHPCVCLPSLSFYFRNYFMLLFVIPYKEFVKIIRKNRALPCVMSHRLAVLPTGIYQVVQI